MGLQNGFDKVAMNKLPLLVIQDIGKNMELEDRLSFMLSNQRVYRALKPTFQQFTKLQISTFESETYIKVGDFGVKCHYPIEYLGQVMELCPNIDEVVIGIRAPLSFKPENPTGCPIFDVTMYHRGGYIAQFFRNAPKSLLSSMKSLLLNVDYYIGQLRNVVQPLPFEDLFFALGNLTDKPFKTSIQIGLCIVEEADIADMPSSLNMSRFLEQVAKDMSAHGCKAKATLEEFGGFNDILVEKGKVDFSFCFFHYDPNMGQFGQEDESEDEEDKTVEGEDDNSESEEAPESEKVPEAEEAPEENQKPIET